MKTIAIKEEIYIKKKKKTSSDIFHKNNLKKRDHN